MNYRIFSLKSICLWIALLVPSISFAEALPLHVQGVDLLDSKSKDVGVQGKKGLVVIFLSAKCPCSNSHIPEVTELSKDYPDFNFVAIHANGNETEKESAEYFKNSKIPFPVIQDDHAKLADQFKALKTPHVFVILADGSVAYQGGVSSSANFAEAKTKFLRDALEDLQKNRKVKTAEGRTLGCVIKRG